MFRITFQDSNVTLDQKEIFGDIDPDATYETEQEAQDTIADILLSLSSLPNAEEYEDISGIVESI
jgi:hypothetical protein